MKSIWLVWPSLATVFGIISSIDVFAVLPLKKE
jgi:hypothetical protein